MHQFLATIALIALTGCARYPTPATYVNPQDDPVYQELKALISAQSDCFVREAKSKSLQKVNIDTAALAVMGRCVQERTNYKAYSAKHTIQNPIQFDERWERQEAKDILFIKQALAMIRTGQSGSD